jgi:hypothetical protein
MQSVEQTLEMILKGRVTCPACGCSWLVTKRTNMTLVAEAFAAHVRGHRRIKAERPTEPKGYRSRTMLED